MSEGSHGTFRGESGWEMMQTSPAPVVYVSGLCGCLDKTAYPLDVPPLRPQADALVVDMFADASQNLGVGKNIDEKRQSAKNVFNSATQGLLLKHPWH